MGPIYDNFQKWFENQEGAILTGLSSLMCLLGCCIVYIDVIYKKVFPNLSRKHKFEINSNGKFMISCLSISSGSLLFTALTKMFPKASIYFSEHQKLKKMPKTLNFILLASFLLGISTFTVLNIIIHRFTSESILHCAHSGTNHHSHHSHSEDSHNNEEHSHSHLNQISEANEDHNEQEPLLVADSQNEYSSAILNNTSTSKDAASEYSNLHIKYSQLKSLEALKVLKHPWSKESSAKLVAFSDLEVGHNNSKSRQKSKRLNAHNHHHHRTNSNGTSNSIIGVSLSKLNSIDDIMLVSESSVNEHTNHSDDHTHKNVETSVSELFSIGIQTTLGICLHKLPEGFIYYLTSKIDQQLSLNIFLSLAIHNIAEGFSMTLPLYLSLNSRTQAVLICGVLGGFSQPFGALLAALIFGKSSSFLELDNINLVFGVLMSVTSGFLTIIALQMLLNCSSFGGSNNFITFWFLFGLLIICFTNILTGNLLL